MSETSSVLRSRSGARRPGRSGRCDLGRGAGSPVRWPSPPNRNERRDQRPGGRELAEQQLRRAGLRASRDSRPRPRRGAARRSALMHIRILPQIDAGEMEAEHFDCAPQVPQPAARQSAGAVGDERIEKDRRDRRATPRLPRKVAPRPPPGAAPLSPQLPRRRDQPRIDADDRPPIRFGGATRRVIGRALAPALRAAPRSRPGAVERQLGAKQLQLLEIEVERLASASDRLRSTSALTNGLPSRSPPIQLPMRRKDGSSAVPAGIASPPAAPRVAINARQLAQEGVVVVGRARWPPRRSPSAAVAQQAGLPQRQDGAAQALSSAATSLISVSCAVALGEKVRHLVLAIEHALAPDLRGMRGQHRARLVERTPQPPARHAGRPHPRQGVCDRAGEWRRRAMCARAMRRIWCWSSAMLARCEKWPKARMMRIAWAIGRPR